MSYAISASLQEAVYTALITNSLLTDLVGDAIYDAPADDNLPDIYVSLGPENVTDKSDVTGRGALHDFSISIVSTGAGFLAAKQAGAAISDILQDADLTLSRGHLIGMQFMSAKARRIQNSDIRQIDLNFQARVEDSSS